MADKRMSIDRIKNLRRETQKEYTQGTSNQLNKCTFCPEELPEACYRTSVNLRLLVIISSY